MADSKLLMPTAATMHSRQPFCIGQYQVYSSDLPVHVVEFGVGGASRKSLSRKKLRSHGYLSVAAIGIQKSYHRPIKLKLFD